MIILKQLDECVLLRVVLPDLMPERGWGVRTGFLRRRGQALSTYIIQENLDITKAQRTGKICAL